MFKIFENLKSLKDLKSKISELEEKVSELQIEKGYLKTDTDNLFQKRKELLHENESLTNIYQNMTTALQNLDQMPFEELYKAVHSCGEYDIHKSEDGYVVGTSFCSVGGHWFDFKNFSSKRKAYEYAYVLIKTGYRVPNGVCSECFCEYFL